ncbi:MAG: hypothetical protein J3K34DRAFT_403887 [Monoraphidium minutum]|nr:MAG: hypothetical protein J3K34DRAFT_403887 [Monoraphidium minutum]
MRMRGAKVEAAMEDPRSPEAAERAEALISQHMAPLRRQVAAQLAARAAAGPGQQPGAPPAPALTPGARLAAAEAAPPVEIQVYFHVLTYDGQGAVPQTAIEKQISVLNAAFDSVFTFRLVRAQQVPVGSDIFYDAYTLYYDKYFIRFVSTLHEGDRTTLNVFTADLVTKTGGLFGVASSPLVCSSPGCKDDNVLIDFDTLPDGGLDTYNEGDNLVHEVGHWLGLEHTFHRETCDPDEGGDEIDDTPQEGEPAFRCEPSDSCPLQNGTDPINNYMDYTNDACKTHFTKDQYARMVAVWQLIRTRPYKTCPASTLPAHPQCDGWALGCANPLHCNRCPGSPCGYCASHRWPSGGECDSLGVGSSCYATCAPGFTPAPRASTGGVRPIAFCGSFGAWEVWGGGCVKESIQVPPKYTSTGQATYTIHLQAAGHAAAREACRRAGGELATLPSENDGYVTSLYLSPWSAWIGLAAIGSRASTDPLDWAWSSTGLRPGAYGYANWGGAGDVPKQPDNYQGQEGQAALLRCDEGRCAWFDTPGTQAEPYICQIMGECRWSALPDAPRGSAWPAKECDGVRSGQSCAALCDVGLQPGPSGPPTAACVGGAWRVQGSCTAGYCSADDLPLPPEHSDWLDFQCDGRASNSPTPCVAVCALGFEPGPLGAPRTFCVHGNWFAVNGACVPAACAVVIEPADAAFAGGEASPISLAEVQLFSSPGGRIKRASLTPGLSASTRDGGVEMCFDGKKAACTSAGASPSLVVAYPCSKQLSKVVVKNAASKNSAALGRITSYRMRLFSSSAQPANVTLAFGDIGPKAQYTAQRAKDGAWGWKQAAGP